MDNGSTIKSGLIGLALCIGLLSFAFTGSNSLAALVGLLVATGIAIVGTNWASINTALAKWQEKWLTH